MIEFLSRRLIRDAGNVKDTRVRESYGILCGIAGIFFNLLLFAGKLTVGLLSGSISIVADAFNNISDAGSSCITLVGFRLAGQKPDPDHPFGHGRIEYLSGLIVSMLIVLMGFELGKSSVERIFSPEKTVFSLTTVIILGVSVLVKLYMAFYNRRIGKKIGSAAMMATATDSISDSVATSVVLLCTLIARFTSLELDAYCGLAVSVIILIAGIRSAMDTVNPLLGQPPEEEFVREIETIVRADPSVVGIHDLVVHDYGPGRRMISLHAEVPADGDILELHDAIDNIENRLKRELSCEAVIHMDPVSTGENIAEAKRAVLNRVQEIDERITIHDFRMVEGPTHTNVIFDAVVPFTVPLSDAEAAERIRAKVKEENPNWFAVVQIDKSYVK